MNRPRLQYSPIESLVSCCVALLMAAFAPASANAQWLQFGGPRADFTVEAAGLADKWPEEGPKQLWKRELGDGYSSITVDEDRLYTMYAKGKRQYVICLKTDSGETVWEHKHSAKYFKGMDTSFGTGPRATPVVAGDRVFAAGIGARLYCLDKYTGKKIWTKNLQAKYKASPITWGYSSSVLPYENTIIVPVGGKGHGVMAFDQETGSEVWSRHDFGNSYSTPVLIDVDGQAQVVAFMEDFVVGLNPDNGDLLWQHSHSTKYNINASMPVMGPDNVLFISSAYGTGSQGLKLGRSGDEWTVEPLWQLSKMQMHFGNVVRVGNVVYGSSGNSGPSALTAVDLKTGKIAWRKRGPAKSTMLYADDKVIMLGEDGTLVLGRINPKGFEQLSQAQLLGARSWAVPTLVRTNLYVRDRQHILALDLGEAG
ncbi:MAG: PQQ-binding-like beta-propeller repeat protein [Phycisphaerae bacterium]